MPYLTMVGHLGTFSRMSAEDDEIGYLSSREISGPGSTDHCRRLAVIVNEFGDCRHRRRDPEELRRREPPANDCLCRPSARASSITIIAGGPRASAAGNRCGLCVIRRVRIFVPGHSQGFTVNRAIFRPAARVSDCITPMLRLGNDHEISPAWSYGTRRF